MTSDSLAAIPTQRVAPTPVPHAWRDSLLASLAGYGMTSLPLYYGMLWLGSMHPSQSQLDPWMVAVIDFIDSLFGWGVLLVPIAFSYRPAWARAQEIGLCSLASLLGLVLAGLETWVLLIDPRFRQSAAIYDAAGILNALLATVVLLALRRRSARHNGIES